MAYQTYSQTDGRWADQRLGTVDGWTIGKFGCLVTAMANIAEHFGKDCTPADLDNAFTDQHLYWNDNGSHDDPAGLCSDGMLSEVYPDIQFTGVYHCEDNPCDLSVFSEFNDYNHEAVVELDASPVPGIQTHFNRFYDYDPATGVVRIVDSEDGQIVSIADRYGDPATVIQKVVKYVGPNLTVSTAAAEPAAPPAPAPVDTAPPAVTPATPPVQVVPVKVDSLSRLSALQPQVSANPSFDPQLLEHYTPVVEDKPVQSVPLFPSRDSAVGRGLATVRQVLLWFGGFLLALSGMVQDPIYHTLILNYAPWLVSAASLVAGVGSTIENLLRKDVNNW